MNIIVRVPIEGTHRYEDAPDEVAYLRNDHRHIFTLELHLEVAHGNRDLEFMMIQHSVREYMRQQYYDVLWKLHNFGPKSCEHVADELQTIFNCTKVVVWEDMENAGVVQCQI